jgi:hypothetical protein
VEICVALIVGGLMGVVGYYLTKYLRTPVEHHVREAMS